jgi:WD40 repeat protein
MTGPFTDGPGGKPSIRSRWNDLNWTVKASVAVALAGLLALSVMLPTLRHPQVTARQLSARAQTADTGDPRRAALLALAAYRLEPGLESLAAVRSVAQRYRYVRAVGAPGGGLLTAMADDGTGNRLFSAGFDGQIRSWDAATGRQLGAIGYAAADVQTLSYLPKAGLLVGGDDFGGIHLWQVDPAGKLSGPVTVATGDDSQRDADVVGLYIYAAGSRLVAVTADGHIRVWSLRVSNQLAAADELGSDDVDRLASDAGIHLEPGMQAPSSVLVGANGAHPTLLIGTDNSGVLSAELSTAGRGAVTQGRLVRAVPPTEIAGRVRGLAAHGSQLAVGTDQGVLIWDWRGGHRISFPAGGLSQPPNAITYSVDGSTLEIASDSGVWLVPSRIDPTLISGEPDSFDQPYLDGTMMITSMRDGVFAVATNGGAMVVLDVSMTRMRRPSAQGSTALAFGPDGSLVLTNTDPAHNRASSLYTLQPSADPGDGQSYEPAAEWFGPDQEFFVNDVAVTDRYVAVAGQDPARRGVVLVWDARTRRPLTTLPFAGGDPDLATSVVLDTALNLLVARNTAGELVAWSTTTWSEAFRLQLGPGGDLEAVGPEGKLLVTTINDEPEPDRPSARHAQLAFVDLERRRVTRRAVPSGAHEVATTRDGRMIAVLTFNDRVLLMTSAGRLLRDPIDIGGFGLSLAFSPDGRQLAISRADGQIVVFDVASRTQAYAGFADRTGDIPVQIAWDPTGQVIAALSGRPQHDFFRVDRVDRWFVAPHVWVSALCELIGGEVSETAWRAAFGSSLPRRDLCTPGH